MQWKKLAAAAALAGLSTQAAAQPACLTSAEAETVIQAMLPSLIENVSERCAVYLPANSAVVARADALSQRYAPAADAARAGAAALTMRMLDGGDTPFLVDDESGGELMIGLFEMGISVAMADLLDAESCLTANRIFETLEPLPARNFAGLLTLLIEIGSRDEDESENSSPFAICGLKTD